MGYSVRDTRWRFTVWLLWNGSAADWSGAEKAPMELYDHQGGAGTDFDAMDVINAAYDPSRAATVATLLGTARYFFLDFLPPAHGGGNASAVCERAGGTLAK